jgi:putative membrane protein
MAQLSPWMPAGDNLGRPVHEHGSAAVHLIEAWSAWDLLVGGGLLLSGAVYAVGLWRLWQRAGAWRGVRWWEALAFATAWSTMAVALLSPLDTLSERLFSAHMTQHELLMLVAAPLFVLGRPLVVLPWVLPARVRLGLRRWQAPVLVEGWRKLTAPVVVLLLHGAVVWIWHVPALFEAALHSDAVHAVQHVGFFWTAALFWWALVHGRYGRLGYGISVVFVFLTAMHQGVLGALLTFAPESWYPTYAARAEAHAVDAVADQQLAGLLMWVPSGVIFLVIGLALFAAWLGEAERRAALAHGAVRPSR